MDIPEQESNLELNQSKDGNMMIHFLTEQSIRFYQEPKDNPYPTVPPNTPKNLISDCYVTILPTIPENIDDIQIPYIREYGIRDSMALMAKHFNCDNYRNNLVQYWFLDIIVDSIWKAQDEFRFSLEQQKVILEWMIFAMKLVMDQSMTRTLFFKVFSEAVSIAEDYIQSGCLESPRPSKIFTFDIPESNLEKNESWESLFATTASNISSSTALVSKQSKNYLAIKYDKNKTQLFRLPNRNSILEEECISSSVEAPSEEETVPDQDENTKTVIFEEESDDSTIDFYKPELSTPPRFKSLPELDSRRSTVPNASRISDDQSKTINEEWFTFPRKTEPQKCPSKFITEQQCNVVETLEDNLSEKQTSKSVVSEVVLNEEDLFKFFYQYHMWQLKNEFMANPEVGWTSLSNNKIACDDSNQKKIDKNDNFPRKLKEMFSQNGPTDAINKNIFINSCILMAVKQMVFDYFYYNFSFELIKTSLSTPQYLITQDINTDWWIPKDIKGDFKKPVPKKPKKEKAKKEKKVKDKKSKDKSKGSKSSKKKDKKSDKKSKGKDKKSKSSKKSDNKKDKLSKEEKMEIEKRKKEEEELENARLREEENKRFMFPLKEAVDDNFFAGIFANYKKGQKAPKSPKSPKSSKGSEKKKGKKEGTDKKAKKKK